jgi:hypothetical protein
MFDANTTITIGLRTAAGKADITVRWPTDEEWGAHRRRRKILQRQLGRGATETEIDSSEADAKLYESIKLNGAPPLSVAEAGRIVDTIATTDVLGVDLHAEDAEVQLNTLMGEVKHTVRIPMMDEVKALQRSTRLISLQYNRSEIRTNLESAAALWDKCGGRAEGYAGAVPNIHKDVAIRAVIAAIEQEALPKYDEANF